MPPPFRQRIVLVEDEAGVRDLMAMILRRAGLDVVDFATSAAALAFARNDPFGFSVLVTDVVMPGLNGPELAREITALRGSLGVLYISGYPGRDLLDYGIRADQLLRKPFASADLVARIRGLLQVGASAMEPS